jgi:NTP pyrophosphatase (non-canonical NTP hydrolase)
MLELHSNSAYFMSDLNVLARKINDWAGGKGFTSPAQLDSPQDLVEMMSKLMLVTTEVAEAAEAVRRYDVANFREEIADTMIRLLHICGAMNIDIACELALKMEKNEGRPYLHGKKL